ncbi:MAG: alpha/beta fold hydrolase [Candidatus Odinarchaeota archaeon]
MTTKAVQTFEMEKKRDIYPDKSTPLTFRAVRLATGILGRIFPGLTTRFLLSRFYKPHYYRFSSSKRSKSAGPVVTGSSRDMFPYSKKDVHIPLEPEHHRLSYESHLVQVISRGQGPAILMVHGWGGSSSSFDAFVERLVKTGYRTVTVDMPAHGGSTGENTSIFDFIGVIGLVTEKFGPFHAFIGHSLGGLAIASAFYGGLHPERTVIISSPSSVEAVIRKYAELLGLPDKIARNLAADVEKKFGIAPADISVERMTDSSPASALIIYDKNDRMVSFEEGKIYARAWPGARFVSTAGLGHHRILRDQGIITSVIDFLGE